MHAGMLFIRHVAAIIVKHAIRDRDVSLLSAITPRVKYFHSFNVFG